MARTMFERAPVGLALWDRDLRCVWFNEAFVRQNPFLVRQDPFLTDTPLGQPAGEILVNDSPDLLERSLHQVLASGDPLVDLDWPEGSGTGGVGPSSMSFFRVEDEQGAVLGVCSLIMDTSESWASKRFDLLTGAATRIGTTLDVMRTAQEMAETAVPGLADYASVDLADTLGADDQPLRRLPATATSIPVFYRAGAASIRPGVPESLSPLGTAVYVPPDSPFTEVLTTRRTYYEPEFNVGPGNWLDRDPDRRQVVLTMGMHSMIVVPLTAREKILGVAVFIRTRNPTPFGRADVILAEGLAERAALSLDNASRYSRERSAVLALQRDLLPSHVDGGNAVEIATRYQPSDRHDVGGDWFDVIPLPGDRVALVVGDVTGHGINAAATMGQLRTAVITLTNLGLDPADVLAHLDRLALDLSRDRGRDQGRDDTAESPLAIGATCVYAVYDPATRRCTLASAGHPPPAVVRPDGTATFAEVTPGAPVGVGLPNYESAEIEVPLGGLLALYTDGLVESHSMDIGRGLDLLRTAFDPPRADLEELTDSVIGTMTGHLSPDDDIALLVARIRRPDEVATD